MAQVSMMPAGQFGTISQVKPAGGSVQMGNMGEPVAGSQRVVQTGQHWWVQHPEDEPLPGCNIPVSIARMSSSISYVMAGYLVQGALHIKVPISDFVFFDSVSACRNLRSAEKVLSVVFFAAEIFQRT
jgi:hypothetical protein